jgi:hypothetical protein
MRIALFAVWIDVTGFNDHRIGFSRTAGSEIQGSVIFFVPEARRALISGSIRDSATSPVSH